MYWTAKGLEDTGDVKLVRFADGRLFSILPDRNKKPPKYTLFDELGVIEGSPQHQGPMSQDLLTSILNSSGATPISLGDAKLVRADHRAKVRQKEPGGDR